MARGDAVDGRDVRIIAVDDDDDVVAAIREVFADDGITVDHARSGEEALERLELEHFDLVVLDLGLPRISGLEVLRTIRSRDPIPVVVLTGRSSETDKVVGLELGADDYVAKPFSPRELLARVGAVLRRSRPAVVAPIGLEFGEVAIDDRSHEVRRNGELVDLTAKEYQLLRFLAASPRQVFTRPQLLEHVWESAAAWQTEATVSEHVHRLRRKIEADPRRPRHIVTVRGSGYRLDP